MAFAIFGAALPAAILFGLRDNHVAWNGPAHCWLVGASALAALAAAALLTFRGAADHDARAVIAGGAFSTMATLLAVHGLATPGVLVGSNGVVALSGGVTIPVGAALLSLLGVPSLSDPRRIRMILRIQLATMVAIFAVSGLGIVFPALVPHVPAPKSLSAILLLIAGGTLPPLVALRAARTYALSRRGADLAILVGVWWLGLALLPGAADGLVYLDWWLGHFLEVLGIALVGLPVALDLRRSAPSRTLTGDLRAVELVTSCESFMGSHLRGLLARLGEKDASTGEHTRRVAAAGRRGRRGARPRARAATRTRRRRPAARRRQALGAGRDPQEAGRARRRRVRGDPPASRLGPRAGRPRRRPIPRPCAASCATTTSGSTARGYPRGLAGGEISLDTRILAVCDVFDALVSERVYRDAWTPERALGLLRERGRHRLRSHLRGGSRPCRLRGPARSPGRCRPLPEASARHPFGGLVTESEHLWAGSLHPLHGTITVAT